MPKVTIRSAKGESAVPGTSNDANTGRMTYLDGRQCTGTRSIRSVQTRASLSRKRDYEIALAALRKFRTFSWLSPDKLEELASEITLLDLNVSNSSYRTKNWQ